MTPALMWCARRPLQCRYYITVSSFFALVTTHIDDVLSSHVKLKCAIKNGA